MLLYIHVPFCHSKCNYCAFFSSKPAPGEIELYFNNLLLEVDLWAERLGVCEITSIFIGGGTPSILSSEMIAIILGKVADSFTLTKDIEVTLEANPHSAIGIEYFRALLNAGINRLSIGVQTSNSELLKLLGRPHSFYDAVRTVADARDAGFGNINIDVMWGLPRQTVRKFKDDLKYIILNMQPDHISSYGLNIEPDTNFYNLAQSNKLNFPSEREQGHMFMYGAELLEEFGFLQYEISNFARMGFQCRHNLGYWAGEDFLGLGPAAVSTLNNKRWTNPFSLKTYVQNVSQKRLPENIEELSLPVRIRELIMLSLRTVKGLDLAEYKMLSGRDFFQEYQELITALHANGLVRMRDGRLRLTRSGMLVSNTILSHIFALLPEIEESVSLPLPFSFKAN